MRSLAFSLVLLIAASIPISAESLDSGTEARGAYPGTDKDIFDGNLVPQFKVAEKRGPFGSAEDAGVLKVGLSGEEYTGTDFAGRSAAKEALLSFLLPGLGQHRMGHTMRSKIYFGLEGIAWISAGAFYWQSVARKDAFEEYAVAYAGVSGTGLSDSYYELIGEYMSNDGPGGYNEYLLIEARELYYPDMEAIEAYYEANMITGDESWRWESDTAFIRYNSLWSGYDLAKNRIVYTLFFALGVRVVSMVDAFRLAGGGGDAWESDRDMSIGIDPGPDGFRLTMCRSF